MYEQVLLITFKNKEAATPQTVLIQCYNLKDFFNTLKGKKHP